MKTLKSSAKQKKGRSDHLMSMTKKGLIVNCFKKNDGGPKEAQEILKYLQNLYYIFNIK